MGNDEEYVKELANKLRGGELSSKEALKGLKERGLLIPQRWEIIPWVIYFILLIPLNLKFSAQLPAIQFPSIVIYISLAIGLLGIPFCIWVTRVHYKRGGLNHDETVILLKDGPYRVMRHPGGVTMMLPILLPIILSAYLPFSPLSVAAIIVMIVYIYYGVYLEEKVDIEKWGDEYRQYMKEVPRFNFILGLWRLRKKRGK
jgi:protein-S-isoprenylcysteine O-methyltransferase Ste14